MNCCTVLFSFFNTSTLVIPILNYQQLRERKTSLLGFFISVHPRLLSLLSIEAEEGVVAHTKNSIIMYYGWGFFASFELFGGL
jgi:hypothetical protein